MQKFYKGIVDHPKLIITIFIVATLICGVLQSQVSVNYDMTAYLPEDSHSTVSLELMENEFEGGIPNARVMVRNVTIPEALEYKEKILACEGVTDVLWLDDQVSIYVPMNQLDADTVETYYKNNAALFTVTISEDKRIEAVDAIRTVIGDENAMSGQAVSTAVATTSTVNQILKITIFAIICVLVILLITTTSWIEPLIVLGGIGVAVIINMGTNLIFGEISFVTNAAGSILQLAVSLDYSVFLMHRFEECLRENPDPKSAMVDALCKSTTSILSSGLTTVIGFVALIFMRFGIGPDLGLALAKGIAVSLICVFVFMPVFILALHKFLQKTKHRPILPSFSKFSKVVYRAIIPMVCVFAIVILPSYLASNENAFYYGSSRIFGTDTQTGADAEAIEEVFGKNDTYVLMVPRGNTATEKELSEALHDVPEVQSILSYVDTVGTEIPMSYLDEDTLSQLVSENYSRVVLTVNADYEGEQTFGLVETIRSIASKYYPDSYYLAGEGVNTYDLMDTITADTLKVNFIAIAAVFVVLLLSFKSIGLPVILVLGIETAIWINLAIPYFTDSVVYYIAYLIISSVQLGATVDYAILMTDRYIENRQVMNKKDAIHETVANVTVSIMTSATVLTIVGFLLGFISTHGILSQLGVFVGRGALLSLTIVLFVIPGLLYLLDGVIQKTTLGAKWYRNTADIKEDISK